jgi:hypothetical protein
VAKFELLSLEGLRKTVKILIREGGLGADTRIKDLMNTKQEYCPFYYDILVLNVKGTCTYSNNFSVKC